MTEDKESVWQIVYSSPLAEAKYWTDPSISHEEELLDKLATLALRGEYLYRPDLNFWIGCLSAAIRTIRNEKHEITSEDIRKFKRYEILEESHPENPENIDREMLLHNAEFIYSFCHYLWNSPEEIKKRETKRQIDRERHQRKQSLFLGTTKNTVDVRDDLNENKTFIDQLVKGNCLIFWQEVKGKKLYWVNQSFSIDNIKSALGLSGSDRIPWKDIASYQQIFSKPDLKTGRLDLGNVHPLTAAELKKAADNRK